MRRYLFPVAITAVVALLVAGGYFLLAPSSGTTHITAYVTRAVSLYKNSTVRILGVPVGTVTEVKPEGTRVKLVLAVDGKYKIPADAGAVIIAPAVVGDRYVQLVPAYTGGPTMRDHAVIPLDRTNVPVELDEIFRNLTELGQALGPNGANKQGALSRLIDVGASNLQGNGQAFNDAIKGLSDLLGTLSDNRDPLVGTIDNLTSFTNMLATNDSGVRQVNDQLATVAAELAGERQDLQQAFSNLATALTQVASFVHDNRSQLVANISELSEVTNVLTKDKAALTEVLDTAPLALQNLQGTYGVSTGTLDTRGDDLAAHIIELMPLICAKLPDGCPAPLQNILNQGDAAIQQLILALMSGNPPSLPAGAPAGANARGATALSQLLGSGGTR